MFTRVRFAGLLVILIQCHCLSVLARSNSSVAQPSSLSGTVFDCAGSVIVHAKITFFNEAKEKVEILTNDKGRYHVDLPARFYRVEVFSGGFNTYRISCYQLPASSNLTLDVTVTVPGEHACDPDGKIQQSKKRKTIIIE